MQPKKGISDAVLVPDDGEILLERSFFVIMELTKEERSKLLKLWKARNKKDERTAV